MKTIIASILILLPPFVLATSLTLQKRSNHPVMELFSTGKSDSFVEQMRESLAENDQSKMLQSYLNSLLKVNAIYEKLGTASTVFYRVQFNDEGKLLVTRNELDDSRRQIDIRSLSVYGISYELDYDCSWQEQLCWVVYPGNKKTNIHKNERWLEISYAPEAINELANGMELLIKELQK
ncbi:hypothetical protein ACH42_12145 [Endozoicomonas sp. (ex Bugula neritina AB1)]|nr:hypothetical protein ACH42_12145 [Endozoicomonas sp. (ex Bugula neritina AB1)]